MLPRGIIATDMDAAGGTSESAATGRSLALITGGGSGIGFAIARGLVRAGVGVVLAGRDGSRLESAVRELRADPSLDEPKGGDGIPIAALTLDVTVAADVERAAAQVEALASSLGRQVDLVVANAGDVEVHDVLDAQPDGLGGDVYDRMFAVCFHGAVRTATAFLPRMVERGRGLVVQVSSAAGLRAFPGIAAYASAKHAQLGWSRAAAAELAPRGVHVAALCPYYVRGAMLERAARGLAEEEGIEFASALERFAARNPGGALVEPERIADETVRLFERASLEPPDPACRVVVLDGGPARPPDAQIDRTP